MAMLGSSSCLAGYKGVRDNESLPTIPIAIIIIMKEFYLKDSTFPFLRDRLSPVPENSPRYAEIRTLFNEGWKHPMKPLPPLQAVFKISSPKSSIRRFQTYKSSLQSPSVSLLFHGTNRACSLGEGNAILCAHFSCSLCAIIRRSFDVSKCGKKFLFARFGKGIYTSACSSKADDYSENIYGQGRFRVMLLNHVAMGESAVLQWNNTNLNRPPAGYQSVHGIPGIHLNYEESVVYTNDAIRPTYLIVYGFPPYASRNL